MKTTGIQISGPRQVTIVEETLPEPGQGQVEIKSICSGISHGTEMNVYRGVAPMWHMQQDRETRLFVPADAPQWQYPMSYGYACVGEVVRIGPNVTRLQPGDVVFAYASHRTGHILPEQTAIKLPEGVDPELGIFIATSTPRSTAWTQICTWADRGHLRAGDTWPTDGATSQAVGASQVVAVDLVEKRLTISRDVSGADVTLNPAEVDDVAMYVRNLTDKRGADAV